jgi:DNA-binding response OmpR family regulator
MGKKILIIDDHADIREMYQSALGAHGYDVISEENGLKGAMRAINFKPDLILLDIMMPQMDGFAVLEALNQNDDLFCKVVVISNLGDDEGIRKALDLGAVKYMVKSDFTPDEFVAEINKILAEA